MAKDPHREKLNEIARFFLSRKEWTRCNRAPGFTEFVRDCFGDSYDYRVRVHEHKDYFEVYMLEYNWDEGTILSLFSGMDSLKEWVERVEKLPNGYDDEDDDNDDD